MKILLDEKEVEALVPESLPMLIHGTEGYGSSLYTIALATKWFKQGSNIIVLTGYPMALQAFEEEVGRHHDSAKFFQKENIEGFKNALKVNISDDTVVFVKNIELFNEDLFDLVSNIKNLIISGDISNSPFKDKIIAKQYATQVYFSPLETKNIPTLNKYDGFVISGDYTGITKVLK